MRKNKRLQKGITLLLTLTLILSGLFTAPKASAETQTKEITIHHMRLDTAVVFAWSDGKTGWQKGIAQGAQYDTQYLIDIGKDMRNVQVKNYEGSGFPFDWSKDSDIFKQHFNQTPVCKNKNDYEDNYKPYFAIINSVGGQDSYSPGSGKLYVKYDVLLSTQRGKDYDVKEKLNEGKQQEILDLLGDHVPSELTKAMNLFSTEAAQIDPKVKGFLYFVPIIIEYDEVKMVEVTPPPIDPEPLIFEASLGLPSEAKQGEAYIAADETRLPKDAQFSKSTLEKHYGDNAWKAVSGWDGSKPLSSISQSEKEIGKVVYRLTVTLKSGEKDDDIKSINITDSNIVNGKAVLALDEYTYEGHPANAFDYSEFTVNGELYTAARAYDEKMASNRFRVVEDAKSKVNQKTSIGAEVTFAEKGFYHVKLEVSPKNGSRLTDIKPIQVRKTPSITASIGGRQKENRKQTLTASVAIYPDQPITEVNITLKDKKTGEKATYTMAEHQITGYIKSRPLKEEKQEYSTNYHLEFLTKYKEQREMEYTISVTDKKGDKDETSGSFTVEPDLPPAPSIDMQTDYYRNQGTNLAHITAQDDTISRDGDDIIRYWQASIDQNHDGSFTEPYQPLSELNGRNLSFGTNKKVAFDKTGVGKVDVKLFVKEKWNEETLEEFITPKDYKKADTKKQTQVNNIAPTVRLEPIKTKTADITILSGGKAEDEEIKSSLNKLKQEFLAEGIDASIHVEQLPTPVDGGRVVPTKSEMVKYNYESQWSFLEEHNFSVDSKRVYKLEGSYPFATSPKSADNHLMQPLYLYACDAASGSPLWMFTLSESILKIGDFSSDNLKLYHDDTDTYLYIITSGKTILLDKKTGTLVTILNKELGESNFVTDKHIITFAKDGIYTIDQKSGTMQKIRAFHRGTAQRIGGSVSFLEVAGGTCYKGSLDLDSQQVTLEKLPGNEKDPWDENYSLVGFDYLGKTAIVAKKQGIVRVYDGSNRLITTIKAVAASNNASHPEAVYDEKGNFTYIAQARTGHSSGSKWYYAYITVWGIHNDFMKEICESKIGDYPSTPRIMYAKQHGHKLLIGTGAEYINVWQTGTGIYRARAILWEVNTNTGAINPENISSLGLSPEFEYGKVSENFFAANSNVGYANVSASAQSRTSALPQQMYEILYKKVSKYANPKKQIKMTMIYDDSSPDSYYQDDFSDAANRIKKEDGKLVFIRSQGEQTHIKKFIDASGGLLIGKEGKTIDAVIKETLMPTKEDTQNVLSVTTKEEGSISKKLLLDPQKKYYYEYDLKAEGDKAPDAELDLTLNYEDTFPTAAYSNEIEYITEEIVEDFEDQKMNAAFTAANTESIYGPKIENGLYCMWVTANRKTVFLNNEIKINVPQGKRAVARIRYASTNNSYSQSMVYINGALWNEGVIHGDIEMPYEETGSPQDIIVPGDNYAHSLYFKDTYTGILPSGENALTIMQSAWQDSKAVFAIDEITLYILDAQPPSPIDEISNKLPGASNWYKASGAVNTGTRAKEFRPIPMLYQAGENGPYSTYQDDRLYGISSADPLLTFHIPDGYVTALVKASANGYQRADGLYFRLKYDDSWCGINIDGIREKTLSYLTRYREKTPLFTNLNYTQRVLDKGLIGKDNTISGAGSEKYEEGIGITGFEIAMIPNTKINKKIYNAGEFYLDKAAKKMYVKSKEADSTGLVTLKFTNTSEKENQSFHLQNLKIYSIENGVKSYVLDEYFGDTQSLNGWSANGASMNIVKSEKPKEEDEKRLVYKKGELVSYGITYSDYENDPSKNQFYKYTHMPFNDGPHPDAAVILDENSNVISNVDKIWNKAIERLYIDGKYMLSHYQIDNTGVESYDKFSNTENLTFYIEGSVEAPWITHIHTVPKTVQEGDKYKLQIGVDDKHKEVLNLTTELYREGKLIYTHKKTGITPGSKGAYPDTLTDYPPIATLGRYEVVATVRNLNGAGLGTYKFSVITQGKITGKVYHTPDWEKNRKKYNLSKSGNENSPRAANVFWSGEKFMLQGKTQGKPNSVKVEILGTNYNTWLKSADLATWNGSLWEESMINKWGRKKPEKLTFRFTAYFGSGKTKTDDAVVIIDSKDDYWQLHRLF